MGLHLQSCALDFTALFPGRILIPLAEGLRLPCVKSLRPSYSGLYPQNTEPPRGKDLQGIRKRLPPQDPLKALDIGLR